MHQFNAPPTTLLAPQADDQQSLLDIDQLSKHLQADKPLNAALTYAGTSSITVGNNSSLQGVNCAVQNTIGGNFYQYQITNVYPVIPAIPRINQLPLPTELFVGRVRSRSRLIEALSHQNSTMGVICNIYGMGGIGKTALAVHVAHAVAHLYDHVLFIDMKHSAATKSCSLVKALQQAIRPFLGYTAKLPKDVGGLSAIYRQEFDGKRCLIVLDDVGDSKTIQAFIPRAGCALLSTSRSRLLIDTTINAWAMPALSVQEAQALFLSRVPHLKDDPLLLALLERCDYLPLALRQLSALFIEHPNLTIKQYLSQREHTQQQMRALPHTDESVYEIIGRTDHHLARTNPLLADRWRMLATCADSFPLNVAAAIWDEHDPYVLETHLNELCRRSLLRYNPATQRYLLPRLLRDIAQQRCEPSLRTLAIERYTAFFKHLNDYAHALINTPTDINEGMALLQEVWPHLLRSSEYLQRQTEMPTSTAELDLVGPDVIKAIRFQFIQAQGN